jgi:glutamate racemase
MTMSLTTVRTVCAVPPSWAFAEITRTFVPACNGASTDQLPDLPARVEVTVVALFWSVPTSATSTRACGAAVPVTGTVPPVAALWSAGAVTVSGVAPCSCRT